MQEILLKIWILKKDYPKALKKLTFFLSLNFFLLNLISFNEQSYQKGKGVWN